MKLLALICSLFAGLSLQGREAQQALNASSSPVPTPARAAAAVPPAASSIHNPAPLSQPHWSFRLPEPAVGRPVGNRPWIRNSIDAFILAKLEKEGLEPSPEADRATLLRRLSLDLRGLPPSAVEIRTFLEDKKADAYERCVDRLLSSPHFGERWGRHWLDLARYADSDGYEKDSPRPYAYLFRDWVIQAINADMPFDQFTVEQLAGDLLPDATLEQKVATGFHRNTLTNKEGGVDQEEFRCKATVDRVSTTGTVWLGLTIGCAECHAHKYDPISQREFFQLYAFFNSATETETPAPRPEELVAYRRAKAVWDATPAPRSQKEPKPPETKAQTLAELVPARATRVHIRGDFLRPGEEVQPGTPSVLHPIRGRGPGLDRLDLARWLFDPANPLTARVTVNRVWHHLFGRGLVSSLDDFGQRGEKPSHPELLDWLAMEFPRLGWSRKALIRLIVTSSTYRQSSRVRPELLERDPNNHWLARQNRFRLEAENVRDVSLLAGGLLNPRVGGPPIRPPLPADIAALGYANSVKWKESDGVERYRRGLYIFFQRTVPYPMLTTFDAPDSNVTCIRRERSNTPLQALTLWNDATFFECARGLAKRMADGGSPDASGTIKLGFEICLGRPPTSEELRRLEKLYEDYLRLLRANPAAAAVIAGPMANAGAKATIHDSDPAQGRPELGANEAKSGPPGQAEMAAWIGVGRTLLNLDEFVTRE